uniref:ZXD family zinc finger C n=1 Tax=Prolemur simus TaxID=1328070 RepID=A0A8C8Z2C8_PROSS
MKAHVVRQHSRHQDLLPQLEAPSPLMPAGELSGPGQSELANLDLAALFSDAPAGGASSAGGSDEALNSGILTIDVTSVSSSLGRNAAGSGPPGQMDPLVLVAHGDLPPSLDSPLVLGTAATVLQQVGVSVEDAAVGAGALGCLVAVPVKSLAQEPPPATSGDNSAAHSTEPASAGSPRGSGSVPALLAAVKVEPDSPPGPGAAGRQEGDRGLSPALSPGPAETHGGRDAELSAGTGSLYLDSGGSAGTDYQAMRLDKEKKQRGTESAAGASESTERKVSDGKIIPLHPHACTGSWLCGSLLAPGTQCGLPGPGCGQGGRHVNGLFAFPAQDEPSGDGDSDDVLPAPSLQLPMLPAFVTVDPPLYVLQVWVPHGLCLPYLGPWPSSWGHPAAGGSAGRSPGCLAAASWGRWVDGAAESEVQVPRNPGSLPFGKAGWATRGVRRISPHAPGGWLARWLG